MYLGPLLDEDSSMTRRKRSWSLQPLSPAVRTASSNTESRNALICGWWMRRWTTRLSAVSYKGSVIRIWWWAVHSCHTFSNRKHEHGAHIAFEDGSEMWWMMIWCVTSIRWVVWMSFMTFTHKFSVHTGAYVIWRFLPANIQCLCQDIWYRWHSSWLRQCILYKRSPIFCSYHNIWPEPVPNVSTAYACRPCNSKYC